MFKKIRTAAQQAKLERLIRAELENHNVAAGASLSFREAGSGIAATIVLAQTASLDPAQIAALETTLGQIDGLDRATVVATTHRNIADAPSPQPAQKNAASGHDNPLGLAAAPPKGATRPPRRRPDNVGRVLVVASGKGGVGKSTVAARIALALRQAGQRVGILDLDIHGPSLPVLFGLDGTRPDVVDGKVIPLTAAGVSLMSIGFLVNEEKAVAWRGPMVLGAAKQLLDDVAWPELDTLVIDTPPGTGDAHLTLLQRTIVDGGVIVSTPSPLALADVRRGAALFQKMDAPLIGLVENMATLPDGSRPFGDGLSDDTLQTLGLPKLASLPLVPEIGATIDDSRPNDPTGAFSVLANKINVAIEALDPPVREP